MFADPVYGGNKDFAGWQLVGFPGAHRPSRRADMAEHGGLSPAACSSACRLEPRSGGPEPWRPKRPMSSSSASARPAASSRPSLARPASRSSGSNAGRASRPRTSPRRTSCATSSARTCGPNPKRQPVTWRPKPKVARDADRLAELRQPGRRRHRALRRGVVALP